MKEKNLFWGLLALAFSIVIASLILVRPIKQIASKDETITVTGSAKKVINSDLGVLQISLVSNSKDSKSAYSQLLEQKPQLYAYLAKFGFTKDKIVEKTLGVSEKNRYGGGEAIDPLGYEF